MAVAKTEKTNPFSKLVKSFRSMFNEMKRVHWPSRRDLAIYTVVVIAVSLIMAVLIYFMDSVVNYLMQFVLR